jgi:sugar phosphate isomerase/epimerase
MVGNRGVFSMADGRCHLYTPVFDTITTKGHRMKPISIQLYTLREQAKTDFIGVLKRLAAIGYTGVEPAGLHGNKPAEIRKVLDDMGLVASSTHGGLAKPENLQEVVDTAKTLGYSLIISGTKAENFKTVEAIKAAAEPFQQATELLKPHGLRMGYHNHWWEMDMVDGKLGLEWLLEFAPGLVSQADLYWVSNFGRVNVPQFVAKHKARIASLHAKDGPLTDSKANMVAVGSGKMDIPACVAAADEKVLEWVVVELDQCATDMWGAVEGSYRYLTSKGLAKGNK